MQAIDFDAVRAYDDEQFSAREVFRTDRSKVVCGHFEPGQFIPVHAPASAVVISVREGTGIVREGEDTHRVGVGDIVVKAGKARGIRADEDERLEAFLVTAPPPSDAEHEPVREGIQRDEFEPTARTTIEDEDRFEYDDDSFPDRPRRQPARERISRSRTEDDPTHTRRR